MRADSVLICVPTFETISTETYKALWELDGAGCDLMFEPIKGYDCATARNRCADKAIAYKADWLLMVDSDTVPPPDALSNALSHDMDVVLGYYQFKNRADGETCLWRRGNWTSRFKAGELRVKAMQGEYLIPAQGGGLGFALVRTSVFGKLARPYFKWDIKADGTETGEDVYFCEQCRKAGVTVYADSRIACGHVYASNHTL